MSLALVQSRALLGLQAPAVTVEVHLANGLPSFTLVGLADVEVKEARERVRSALQNAGLDFPNNKRITVNLAPADLPKVSLKAVNENERCFLRLKNDFREWRNSFWQVTRHIFIRRDVRIWASPEHP